MIRSIAILIYSWIDYNREDVHICVLMLFLIVESVTCASYQIYHSHRPNPRAIAHLDYCNSSVVVVVVGSIGLLVFILQLG